MKVSDQAKTLLAALTAQADDELTRNLAFLASREKHNLKNLIAHLMEYDRRRLSREAGYPSTFHYCVSVLGYDEGDAYRRIHAARVCRDHLGALDALEDGSLSMSCLALLSPVIRKVKDPERLIEEARGKSKRELEYFLGRLFPLPPASDSVRVYTVPRDASPASAAGTGSPAPPHASPSSGPMVEASRLEVLAPPDGGGVRVRVRIGFDAGAPLLSLIERARQILRHKYPEGRFEDILRDALETLLERADPQRRLELKAERARAPGSTAKDPLRNPARGGRYIPAKVKDAVWLRDGGRCAWRFEDGVVCGARDFLEYDHIVPFARGGRSDNPRNIRLLCRMHNGLAAERAGLGRPSAAGG